MRHHPRFVLYPISSFSLPDFELLSKQIKKPEMAELNCFAAVVLDEIVSHKQRKGWLNVQENMLLIKIF